MQFAGKSIKKEFWEKRGKKKFLSMTDVGINNFNRIAQKA